MSNRHNPIRTAVWKRLKKEFGEDFEPVYWIMAKALDPSSDLSDMERNSAVDKVLPYLMPKLKQIEVKGQIDVDRKEEYRNAVTFLEQRGLLIEQDAAANG